MKIRKFVATTVATTSLAFGVGGTALATRAGADTTTPSTLPAAVCQRAHDRYVKLVDANQKAKVEYEKARDREAELRPGHEVGGEPARHPPRQPPQPPHRDRRAVETIRARVQARCGDPGPDPAPVDS